MAYEFQPAQPIVTEGDLSVAVRRLAEPLPPTTQVAFLGVIHRINPFPGDIPTSTSPNFPVRSALVSAVRAIVDPSPLEESGLYVPAEHRRAVYDAYNLQNTTLLTELASGTLAQAQAAYEASLSETVNFSARQSSQEEWRLEVEKNRAEYLDTIRTQRDLHATITQHEAIHGAPYSAAIDQIEVALHGLRVAVGENPYNWAHTATTVATFALEAAGVYVDGVV